MRSKKLISILIIAIFLLTSFLPHTVAEESLTDQNDNPDQNDTLFDRFVIRLFEWAHESFLGSLLIFNKFSTSWKAFRFTIPMIFDTRPNTVNLEHLNETEIKIGIIDSTTNDFRQEHQLQFAAEAEYYEFDLVFPEGLDPNAWFYTFEPKVFYATVGEPLITTLRIYSRQPDYLLPPTKLEFKVNITRHVVYGFLFLPPKENRIRYGGNMSSLGWLISSIVAGFWKLGGTDQITYLDVPLMVRADRFHLARIITPETMEVGPDELVKVPIEIQNLGTYKDSFSFRVINSGSEDLVISPPSTVTLDSQETITIFIGVASPRNFNDPGTLHDIKVEVFSIFDTDKVFSNEVSITTRGIYVSDANLYYAFFILILIVFVALFFYFRRVRKYGKYCGKPDKPWGLPEEKRYLDRLRERDKKKYDEAFSMMEDEYRSSLLWYKYYCNAIIEKERIKRLRAKKRYVVKKVKSIEKKPERVVDKSEVKKGKPVEEIEKGEPSVEVEPIPVRRLKIDREVEVERRRKERLLSKIRRQQERQRRKISYYD